MKTIVDCNGIHTFEFGDSDERNLSCHGWALKQIIANQVMLMDKLLQIEDSIRRQFNLE